MKKDLNPEAMKLMADLLKTLMPEGWGFTLVTFKVNVPMGEVLYVSGGNRQDMKETLKALIDKCETMEEFKNPNLN